MFKRYDELVAYNYLINSIMSTIFVAQEGPANALALNKDFTQVVIAGRNGNCFKYSCNTIFIIIPNVLVSV